MLKYAKAVFLQWKMLGTSVAFGLTILFAFRPELEKFNIDVETMAWKRS